jgi:2-amino-4-hydroxy-6-hydroxymethyldihydropteridine diphosphokinase
MGLRWRPKQGPAACRETRQAFVPSMPARARTEPRHSLIAVLGERGVAMTPPVCAFIGLGANLGSTLATLEAAVAALARLPQTELQRCSAWYRSAPVDASGPDFVNAVVQLETRLAPHELLAHLHVIEREHGRERLFRNAPRTLDLDLLLYGDTSITTPTLTVPHPRLHQRAFVLLPLAELWPQGVVPGRGAIAALLAGVADQAIERLADNG